MPSSAESIVMTEAPNAPQPPAAGQRPDSIEDQFTSMTQTLQNLKIPEGRLNDDDDEDKKGFFSRFRK